MKLTDFDKNKIATTEKALKENYNVSMNFNKMSLPASQTMLKKVRGLISEAKQSQDFYSKKTTPAYMKLVFMEQALSYRVSELMSRPSRIVLENEEVEKSQVVLAAQDMVDSVQKMIEEVSDMLVKELPALTDSIQSEIGANEGTQFSSQASEALTAIQSALTSSQATLKSALGTITGQGGMEEFEPDMGGDAAAMGEPESVPGEEEAEMDIDVSGEEEIAEPEPMAATSVGRTKR
jgi:hypothetical protein